MLCAREPCLRAPFVGRPGGPPERWPPNRFVTNRGQTGSPFAPRSRRVKICRFPPVAALPHHCCRHSRKQVFLESRLSVRFIFAVLYGRSARARHARRDHERTDRRREPNFKFQIGFFKYKFRTTDEGSHTRRMTIRGASRCQRRRANGPCARAHTRYLGWMTGMKRGGCEWKLTLLVGEAAALQWRALQSPYSR